MFEIFVMILYFKESQLLILFSTSDSSNPDVLLLSKVREIANVQKIGLKCTDLCLSQSDSCTFEAEFV